MWCAISFGKRIIFQLISINMCAMRWDKICFTIKCFVFDAFFVILIELLHLIFAKLRDMCHELCKIVFQY